jgi:hypothetical protein
MHKQYGDGNLPSKMGSPGELVLGLLFVRFSRLRSKATHRQAHKQPIRQQQIQKARTQCGPEGVHLGQKERRTISKGTAGNRKRANGQNGSDEGRRGSKEAEGDRMGAEGSR